MKKIYKKPCVKISCMEQEVIMADSGVTGNNGIGWGGVDEAGNKDPDANSTDIWDDNVWANEPSSF